MKKQVIIYIGIALILLLGGIFVWQQVKAPQAPTNGNIQTPTTPTVPTPLTPTVIEPTTPTQNHNPPQGWKTYKNKEFGFAFDYPGDWELEVKGVDRETRKPYVYYTLYLWAPDQEDRSVRGFMGPRIYIYSNDHQESNTKEKIEENLKNFEGIVKLVNLRNKIDAYFTKNLTGETIRILFRGVSIGFGSQHNTSLDMDIVNTFRLIGKE